MVIKIHDTTLVHNTILVFQGYKPANEEPSEYQTIPLNKIEDFGVHCKQYYSLEVTLTWIRYN